MLTLNKDTFKYKYYPKTYKELKDIVRQLLEERGPDADLNDICISDITDLSNLFQGLNPGNIKIDKWDVKNVEDMSQMFYMCKNFNADLSKWNVSNVDNMALMFFDCQKFNSDLSAWDTGKVRNMTAMFNGCTVFDSDLNNWDLSSVENISMMFQYCDNFNKSYTDKWDISNISDTKKMNAVFDTSADAPSWYKKAIHN